MTARVLLIQPPLHPEELYTRGSRATASLLPPLGLAYLAGYLEAQGHQVRILDGIVDPWPLGRICQLATGYDVIGITAISSYVLRVVELIRQLKLARVAAPVVVGGPHATALPETLLRHGADFAVVGEGEHTMAQLIEHLDTGSPSLESIAGLRYLDGRGQVISTGRRRLIEPLDSLPLPARHLLPMERYHTSVARSHGGVSHSLMASRGCLGGCTFCSRMTFGGKVRHFSAERVVEEFILLRDRYRAGEVAVWDDDFTAVPEVAVAICEGLLNRKVAIPWSASACVETVSEDLLRLMRRAGCNYIAYGIESGSPRMLQRLRKRVDKDRIRRVIALSKRLGFSIRAYFILGFPGESAAEMEQTIEFARELDVDLASFTLFIPLPGTREYQRACQEGSFDPEYFFKMLIPEINFPDRPVYVPAGMTAAELMAIHRRAYNRVYLRPRVVVRKLLACLRRPSELTVLWRGGQTLLANLLWRGR